MCAWPSELTAGVGFLTVNPKAMFSLFCVTAQVLGHWSVFFISVDKDCEYLRELGIWSGLGVFPFPQCQSKGVICLCLPPSTLVLLFEYTLNPMLPCEANLILVLPGELAYSFQRLVLIQPLFAK